MIIRPFNAAYLLLLAFAAGAVVLLWALLRGRSERCRAAVLIALCAVNIIGFFVYKGFLSRDVQFLQASGLDRFNWFSELPLQLCNINMFLIPIGILTHRRSLLGFAFFRRAARCTHGARVSGGAVCWLLSVAAADAWLLRYAYPHHRLRSEPRDARLLPTGFSGHSRYCGHVFAARYRCAGGQFPAAAHGLPAGKLLLCLRRGRGHQHPEPVLEVAARAVFV